MIPSGQFGCGHIILKASEGLITDSHPDNAKCLQSRECPGKVLFTGTDVAFVPPVNLNWSLILHVFCVHVCNLGNRTWKSQL